ncbi:hypothetical protein HII31_06973 [Pseudocercospora fuligena]|uniref:Uncharacterized protein n=1 Tax=Pseudocercospora fuligena TaxID=685502 RepID=A0A8H6RI29_9PEZI|nr:hypothetical protein HII31_06973 [Pseudocercospora fuligena]
MVGDNGMRTYRLRKYGNKPLPLPEIMDPIYLEARHKFKQPKADAVRDEDELTPFQRKLALNPHARALATSHRQCRLTQVRLPNHFLAIVKMAAEEGRLLEDEDTAEDLERPKDTPNKTRSCFVPLPRRGGTESKITFVLGTREVVEHLGKKTNWKVLVPEDRRDRQWEWDKDMPNLYLRELRDMTLRQLGVCLKSGLSQGTMTNPDNAGCILLTSERDQSSQDLFEALSEDFPTEGQSHTIGNAQLQSYEYDLRNLFSPEQVVSFMSEHDIKDEKIVLSEHRETTRAIVYLEKLQDYIR